MKANSAKRIAADLLNCGVKRIKILDVKKIEEAVTREDIRRLVNEGVIVRKPIVGHKKEKKRRGRQGPGRRKGSKKARTPKKESWMRRVRAQRKLLRRLIEEGVLDRKYRDVVYAKIKGGLFKSKRAMLAYLQENEMIKVDDYEKYI